MSFGLYTDEILKRVQSDTFAKRVFMGVYAKDELPDVYQYPCSAIVNTDPSSLPGEHWVAFDIDERGGCNFFDSFGRVVVSFFK